MILKIQDAINGSKWYYYDHIDKISLNHNEYLVTKDNLIRCKNADSDKSVTKEDLNVDANFTNWSHDEHEEWSNSDNEQCKVVVAIFRSPIILHDPKSGDELCVAFNKQAYLLNDEGKTIERIS